MRTYLNVGLIQGTGKEMDYETCLERLERDVSNLMRGMNRPEIIFGVEMGIGRYFQGDSDKMSGDTIPGKVTDRRVHASSSLKAACNMIAHSMRLRNSSQPY